MFRRDVLILEVACLHLGVVEHLVRLGGQVGLRAVPVDFRLLGQLVLQIRAQPGTLYTQRREQRRNHSVPLFHECQEHMIGIQTGMIVPMGQRFRSLDRFLGFDGKLVESHTCLL